MGFAGLTPKHRTQRGKVELYEGDRMDFLRVSVDELSDRGDIGYWNTRWVEVEAQLRKCPYPLRKLDKFIPDTVERDGTTVPGITYGQVGKREYPPAGTTVQQQNGTVKLLLPTPRRKEEREGVLYLQVRNILRTGLDPFASPVAKRFVEKDSYNDSVRSRVYPNDLIIVNSGIGSLGRVLVVTEQYPYALINISQHLTRVVLDGISPEWCCIYLQTQYGAYQLIRLASGVSGQIYLDFSEIGRILVPVPKRAIQDSFRQGYRYVVDYHLQAMEAKARNDKEQFQRYLYTALGIQEMLIWQAEQAIEGKESTPIPVMPEKLPKALLGLLEDEYARIGAIVEQADTKPRSKWLKARPLGIPLEREDAVVEELARLTRLLKGLEEFRDASS